MLFPSGLRTTSLRWGSRCVRGIEDQWRASSLWGLTVVSTSLLTEQMTFLLTDLGLAAVGGFTVMGHVAGSSGHFDLWCGQLLSQGSSSHSGI